MSSSQFKHNKKRNTGLVYEFLVRLMSEMLLENNNKPYKKSLDIIKKFYYKGSPLDKERQLFSAILENRNVSERVAAGILREVMEEAKKLDFRISDIKKSNLIKEIHFNFGKEFFSRYRMDDYKAYASIQLFINGCNPKRTIYEGTHRVKLEESLMRFMCSSIPDDIREEISGDYLTYKIAVKKFNEHYGSELSNSQKRILKEYILLEDSGDKSDVIRFFNGEKKEMYEILKNSSYSKEFFEDEAMLERLDEVKNKLKDLDVFNPSDKVVEELMLFRQLVEEIESDE